MTVRKLEKREWHPFLENISKLLEGKRAEIEIASLRLGDQIESEWLPLEGLAYDPKDDVVEVLLEGHDHLIHKPREIYIDAELPGMTSLEVVDAEGTKQIVKLKDPLMLPAPAH